MLEPTISMIIPVRDGGPAFRQCLAAIAESAAPPDELIVVDDGSTDGSAEWAAAAGARVLRTASAASGPAAARNLAAAHASGALLFFCDADVRVRPGTLAHIRRAFAADDGLTALFGSYDDQPADRGFLSQYKNLFHHYVHQHAADDASTFWSGCGAIRREAYLAHGGFSDQYRLPSIEDIELGYRLKRQGHRIRLDKGLQVTHLKRWTWPAMLRSDILARGIPWTRLILREGAFLNDLNLQTHNRVSVVTVYAGLLCALAGIWQPLGWLGLAPAALLLLVLNWHFYRFLAGKRGWPFALAAVGPHWLYYFYNGVSFSLGLLLHLRQAARRLPGSRPAVALLSGEGAALVILLVAAYLRFHRLGAQSMWLDELLQIDLARRSPADIVRQVLFFGAMPLDYLITHMALRLGDGDYWLRAAPALWSTLAVAVMYRLAGQWLGRPAGVIASALLAIAAFHVRYGQEARPYALFGLLALCSFHFLLRALDTNRAAHWFGYAATTTLSLFTHYFTIFAVGAQVAIAAAVLLRRAPAAIGPRALRLGLALAFVLLALGLSPYFSHVLGVGRVFAASLLTPVPFTIAPEFDSSQGPPPVVDRALFEQQLLLVFSGGGPWRWAFAGLGLIGLAVAWPRETRKAASLLIWVAVPIALTLAFLIHRGAFFAVRYVTPAFFPWIILIALAVLAVGRALASFARRWVGSGGMAVPAIWAAALAVPAALSLWAVRDYYALPKEDWRGAGRFIDLNFAPGDVVDAPGGGRVIFHYARRAAGSAIDASSPQDLAGVRGRLWVVIHPYIGPAAGALTTWVRDQPSAVEYRVDEALRVFVVDPERTRAELLASIVPPDTAAAWGRWGEQYALAGDPVRAEEGFTRAVDRSEAAYYRWLYGDFLRQAGRGDEAVVYYLDALRRDPDYAPALVGMGRIYLQRGLAPDAVAALERAAAAAPDDYAANYFLARAYDRSGRAEEAAVHRDRAGRIVPDLIEPP